MKSLYLVLRGFDCWGGGCRLGWYCEWLWMLLLPVISVPAPAPMRVFPVAVDVTELQHQIRLQRPISKVPVASHE